MVNKKSSNRQKMPDDVDTVLLAKIIKGFEDVKAGRVKKFD